MLLVIHACIGMPMAPFDFKILLKFVPKVWKRIDVMVCKKSAYPNCSGALTNCSGRLITATEALQVFRKTYNC